MRSGGGGAGAGGQGPVAEGESTTTAEGVPEAFALSLKPNIERMSHTVFLAAFGTLKGVEETRTYHDAMERRGYISEPYRKQFDKSLLARFAPGYRFLSLICSCTCGLANHTTLPKVQRARCTDKHTRPPTEEKGYKTNDTN